MKDYSVNNRRYPWQRMADRIPRNHQTTSAAVGWFDVDDSDGKSRRSAQTAGQAWCARWRPDLRCVSRALPSGRVRVSLEKRHAKKS